MKGILLKLLLGLLILCGQTLAAPKSRFLNPYPQNLPNGSDMPAPEKARTGSKASFLNSEGQIVPTVRLAYIIPINRTPQLNGVTTIRDLALSAQDWYRDQMRLHGYTAKAFRLEMEADGVTPRVQVVAVAGTDAYLREDIWGHTLTQATSAGVSIWAPGEIWLLFTETQSQNTDSTVIGGSALGAGLGSGLDPGVTVIGGDLLARALPAYLTDNRAYDGNYLPEIGPYMLKQNISFAGFEGTTFSSICSAARGAFIHELGHALGLPHDFRNEWGAHGNIMGNGFRGLRGCHYPGSYGSDFATLGLAAARVINTSRYFNDGLPETILPNVTMTASGLVSSGTTGMVQIDFSAADASGLSSAVLTLDGDYIADQALAGKSYNGSFNVSNFRPATANNYQIFVYDIYGNKQTASAVLTLPADSLRAPNPYIKVSAPLSLPGQTVVLDASNSNDPSYGGDSLTVQWDLDGDQIFDTLPTVTKTLSLPLSTAGTRLICAQICDPAGRKTISAPILLHTECPQVTASLDRQAATLQTSWLSSLGYNYQLESSSDLLTWNSSPDAARTGTGLMLGATRIEKNPAFWSRLRVSQRQVP